MTARRVVRRIDHLFVAVEDAGGTFEMLGSRLGLVPLIAVTDHGPVRSGAFNLGDVYLEILESPTMSSGLLDLHGTASPGALEVNGLAFEPEPVEDTVAELDRRGIPHSSPTSFLLSEEREPPNLTLPADLELPTEPQGFTLVQLAGFVGDKATVFCCQSRWPMSVAREAMRRKLAETPERPLPIDGVAEVLVGATDVDAEHRRWRTLLDPVRDGEPGLWDFGDGPALRLVKHDRDAVVGLKLRVGDLERSERYLKEHDMLASSTRAELAVAREALGGLDVSLVPSGEEVTS